MPIILLYTGIIKAFLGQTTSTPKKRSVIMFDKLCLILSIIGSLNWGLVGLFKFDLVAWIFGGSDALLARIIYTVIALAGIWCISFLFRSDKEIITRKD